MQIIDCLNGDIKASGLSVGAATEKYAELGGRMRGYCLAEDDEPVVKKERPDENGWLF